MDLQLGYRCNNNCFSCIIPETVFGRRNKFEKVLEKVDDAEVLTLGGGEPTVNPDFFGFIGKVRKRKPDMPVHILTNARKFSDKCFAEKLNDSFNPLKFSVSVYGSKKNVHEKVTRVEGSFEETMNGIENILSKGFELDIKFVVNRFNYRRMPEAVRFFEENFADVSKLVFVMPRFTGRAWKNREDVFVPYERISMYAEIAVEIADLETELYHFPLCKLKGEARKRAETGVTKYDAEGVVFKQKCGSCSLKDRCPGIWETYLEMDGGFEPDPL